MKRTKIFIVAVLVTFSVFADYPGLISTPNGSVITVTYRDEHDADYIYDLTESTKEAYPNATCMGNASNRYNSHCYAWHMQDNHDINRECWLNNSDVFEYWEDGSYVSTTSDEATVIYYPIGEHSAIKSWRNSSLYISKWGDGPLMEHAPTYGPIGNMSVRQYYKKHIVVTPDVPEPEEPVIIPDELVPGTGTYLRNQEYQFMQGEFDPDKYIFEWSVTESEHGANAIASGKVRLDTKDAPHIAKITFLSAGLFDVRLEVYDADEILVGVFTCQAYVQ